MLSFLNQFLHIFFEYCQEIWLALALGFLISGLFHQFISTKIVEQHLGEKGLKPIAIAAIVGVILPVCCLGSLPIALTLKRKGASLSAVLAFLVATPATSISALFVCWKLLGPLFTFLIFCTAIVIALVLGFATYGIKIEDHLNHDSEGDCCHSSKDQEQPNIPFSIKIKNGLRYAFITLPKEIGLEILIGIALASFITVFEPLQHLIREYLVGIVGYGFVLVVGLLTYVCSTASVSLADAFMQSGLSFGQALCYLIVGPITSYGTILVVKKEFGFKILVIYLGVICFFSVFFGMLFDRFIF